MATQLVSYVGICAVPDDIGEPDVHVLADGLGQLQKLLGVRALGVLLLPSVRILHSHLDELHTWLVLVEIGCIGGEATHAAITQDKIQLVQLPFLRVHKYAC